MRKLKLIPILILVLTMACSPTQINRAVSIASTVPGLIAVIAPGNDVAIKGANEIITALKVFRDNPTGTNYQNAMSVIDGLIARNVFNFNPRVLGVIQAVRVVLSAIAPTNMSMSVDEKINVKDVRREDVNALQSAVDELKREAKK